MKTIAVVEDNADSRLLMGAILSDSYAVVEYETAMAAWEGFQKNKPDLVMLDISLPEMDGAQLLKKIRSSPALHNLPVIALTAHAMAGDREKHLTAGFDDYITKPILDEQEVLRAIERMLNYA